MMLKVYVKPLLTKRLKGMFQKILDKRLKYNLARAGVKNIKNAQRESSTTGKGARIRKGIRYTIGRSSVTFYLTGVGVYHNFGVRRHKMKYLTKARRPIPMHDRQTGELIFRWASKKSMRKPGKWIHPGMDPKNFLKTGVEGMKKEFRKRLSSETKKYLSGKR